MQPIVKGIMWGMVTVIIVGIGVLFGTLFSHQTSNTPLPIAEASGQALGGTTYHGITTNTSTGVLTLGSSYGIAGANTRCQGYYPNSHICTQGEILASGVTSIPGSGWIVCDFIPSAEKCVGVTDTVDGLSGSMCSGYTSTVGSGVYVDATGTMAAGACNVARAIHCCT